MAKKSGQQQTSEVRLDPGTQELVENQLRPAATEAAGVATGTPGHFFNPATQGQIEAAGSFGGLRDQLGNFFGAAGGAAQNLGFAGGQGLQGINQFFNPFQDEVIAGVQGDFARQRDLAEQGAQQLATQAGAFGGSREAILRAEGINNVNRNEASTLANIRQGGFNNAANQLLGSRHLAANLGLGGLSALGQGLQIGGGLAGQQFGIGEGLRGINNQQAQEALFRQQQRLGFLNQGIGPFGQSGSQSGPQGSLLGGAAGGALAGSAFGLPGALVGGGVGLLGGLF